jgi:large repetitive protein
VRGRREGLDRTCLVGLQGLRSIVLAAACLFPVLASAPVALAAPNLPPTINSFDPNAGIPGQTVTVSGPHVGDATTAVAFNGVPAARFSVLSPSRVSAVVPLAATTGPVSLTTPAGTATSSGSFTVPPPVLVSVQPNQAVVGQSVTVWGFNCAGVTEVRFNGALVKSFTIVSPIQIQAIVPNDATTGPVTVTAASGTASSFLPFTLIQAPQTVSFSSAAPTAATAFGATYTPIATAS